MMIMHKKNDTDDAKNYQGNHLSEKMILYAFRMVPDSIVYTVIFPATHKNSTHNNNNTHDCQKNAAETGDASWVNRVWSHHQAVRWHML
jgi:hypothetical protein